MLPLSSSALPRRPDRRNFLQISTGTLVAAGLWPLPLSADLPPLETHQRAWFTAREWDFVLAAVARLIPSDGAGPGALEARVPVFLDLQLAGDYGRGADWYMQGPHDPAAPPEFGWQTPLSPAGLYRQAIPAFNAWCEGALGAAFPALSGPDQDRALTALEKGDTDLADELSGFFDLLLTNTKEGYLSDPIHGGNHGMLAWVHIGFPGARAQYLEWVGQHNRPYRLGPVSISGERA